MSKNPQTTIFLINDDVRCIVAIYEDDNALTGKKAPREYFKTFDKSIAVDDLILVPTSTRHNVAVCKVVEIDVEIDLDHPPEDVRWIIGTVDLSGYLATAAAEKTALDSIRKAEKQHSRKVLQEKMFGNVDQDTLSGLKSLNAPAALPPE